MRSILLIGSTFILAACGSDDLVNLPPAPSPASISGAYQITTFGGHNLPVTVVEIGAYQASLLAGTLELNANNSYSFEFNLRLDENGNPRTSTITELGSWSVTGDRITLASTEGNLTRTGTVSGNAITLESGSIALVRRQ